MVYYVEKPCPFISQHPLTYMVMLQDFLLEIYGIFLILLHPIYLTVWPKDVLLSSVHAQYE